MTVKEELIREAVLKCGPEDLEDVLTTIEAYRTCLATAERLRRAIGMRDQRIQALNCAGHCEAALGEFVATGRLRRTGFPETDCGSAHLWFSIRW